MVSSRKISFLAALTLVAAGSAHASTVTENFSVTASDFVDAAGSLPAPIDPMTLTFSLTFDPTQYYFSATTTGLTLGSVNVPYTAPFTFTYFPDSPGGLQVSSLTQYSTLPGNPPNVGFDAAITLTDTGYSLANAKYYSDGNLFITAPPVPLPPASLLFGTAILGLIGFAQGKSARPRAA